MFEDDHNKTSGPSGVTTGSSRDELIANDASTDREIRDWIGDGDKATKIAGTTAGVSQKVAPKVGGSTKLMARLDQGAKIVGVAGSIVSGASQAYEYFKLGMQYLGTRVEYGLRTWNSADGIGDSDKWSVRSVEIQESINGPCEAIVTADFPNVDFDPTVLLGANARLRMEREPRRRSFKGVISKIRHGAIDHETTRVRLSIVPAFLLADQSRNTRIWQDKTVPEILEEILAETLAPFERKANLGLLRADYPMRSYSVQYQESDYAFACRLMEEEGISFHFVHDYVPDPNAEECASCKRRHSSKHECKQPTEVLTLTDDNEDFVRVDQHDPLPTPIVARGSGGTEGVCDLQRSAALMPTGVIVGGRWDFSTCAEPGSIERGADPHGRERVVFDHGVELTLGHGDATSNADAPRQAGLRRGLQRMGEQVYAGLGFVSRMAPGQKFEMAEHSNPDLNGVYVITSVTHHSTPPAGDEAAPRFDYHNRFECIPESVRLLPERKHIKPKIHGATTALVCDRNDSEAKEHPADSDVAPIDQHRVHSDEYGRVKLWFPWDRYGRRNERSTGWVRVQQMLAGSGWGTMFVPHVGMEVIVMFMDGDPDRPVVTGTLFNAKNLPPYDVKEVDNRKCGLRTVRGNELRSDDTPTAEQVFLRARRDLETRVEHDRCDYVGHDDAETVEGNQHAIVRGERTREVHGTERVSIEQEQHVDVRGGLRRIHVTGENQLAATRRVFVDAGEEILLQIGVSGSSVRLTHDTIELRAGGGASLVLDANIVAVSNAGSSFAMDGSITGTSASKSASFACLDDGSINLVSTGGGFLVVDPVSVLSRSPSGRSVLELRDEVASLNGHIVELSGSDSTCRLAPMEASLRGLEVIVQDHSGESMLRCNAESVDVQGPEVNLNC